jgi:hypothetical protein
LCIYKWSEHWFSRKFVKIAENSNQNIRLLARTGGRGGC